MEKDPNLVLAALHAPPCPAWWRKSNGVKPRILAMPNVPEELSECVTVLRNLASGGESKWPPANTTVAQHDAARRLVELANETSEINQVSRKRAEMRTDLEWRARWAADLLDTIGRLGR